MQQEMLQQRVPIKASSPPPVRFQLRLFFSSLLFPFFPFSFLFLTSSSEPVRNSPSLFLGGLLTSSERETRVYTFQYNRIMVRMGTEHKHPDIHIQCWQSAIDFPSRPVPFWEADGEPSATKPQLISTTARSNSLDRKNSTSQ